MSIKPQIRTVSFTIDEIRPLVLKHIDSAQNILNPDCLMKCTIYSVWHTPLIIFYDEYKNKQKPSMTDKFAFVILLSYPKIIIEKLQNISELSLFGNIDDDFDFIYNKRVDLYNPENHYGENTHGSYDCICSYNGLCYIHYVENKHTNITLIVGSECIKQYKLLSPDEYKNVIKNDKQYKERLLEIKEGHPIGYYQDQKRLQKLEKDNKKIEKDNKKLDLENQKNDKLLKKGNHHICGLCKTNIINKTLKYCHQCVSPSISKMKTIECSIIRDYGLIECQDCDKNYIDNKTENYICRSCSKTDKIIKCQTFDCPIFMFVNKTTLNMYCDDCILNTYTHIKCFHCLDLIYVKKIGNQKLYCDDCYEFINNKIEISSRCNCGLNMVKKMVKKDGANNGRFGFGCVNFPNGCNQFVLF